MVEERLEKGPQLHQIDDWLRERESNHFLHKNKGDEQREEEFFARLPNSDLAEWIYRDQEIFKAHEAFPVWRLSSIRQLSFLAYVGPSPDIQLLTPFEHSRHEHTLFAAQIVEKILQRNHADDHTLKLGINVAMVHDQATPGLGDATKKIDPDALSEEDYWYEVMEEKGWEHLRKNGISREEMDDAIHNKGLVGKVLDIADRISYVMLDLNQIVQTENMDKILIDAQELGYRAEIAEILQKDTNIGSIYQDIDIDWETEEVYFRNPERLSRFLEIRALLNKNLYMHPISLARDMMVARTIEPFYARDVSDDGILTPTKLRKMSDDQVISFIASHHPDAQEEVFRTLGKRIDIYQTFIRWTPQHFEKFTNPEELDKKRRELEKEGFFINGVIESKPFNPATEYKVLDDEGKIVPFRQYDPDCAGRIERISSSMKGHILYWQETKREIDGDFYLREYIDTPPTF